jgi:hypothetical protein
MGIPNMSLAEKARINRWLLEQGYVYLPWDNDAEQKKLEAAYVELVEINMRDMDFGYSKSETEKALLEKIARKLGDKGHTHLIGETSEERIMKSAFSIQIKLFGTRTSLPDTLRKKVNYYQLLKEIKNSK